MMENVISTSKGIIHNSEGSFNETGPGCVLIYIHKIIIDNTTVIENSREEDSDGGSVNASEAGAVPANGNIYTNYANDNSREIGTSLHPMSVNMDSRRSRSCSIFTN